MSKYIVARANLAVFLVLIAILGLIGCVTWDRSNAARSAVQWSQHTYKVLGAIQDLNLAVDDAEAGERGYLLTGSDDLLAPYESALGRVSLLQAELLQLTADNPVQQQRLRALFPKVQHKLELLAQSVQMRRSNGLDAAIGLVRGDAGPELAIEISSTFKVMAAEEQHLLAQRLAVADSRGKWVFWLVAFGTLIAVVALIWAALTLNRAWSQSSRAERDYRSLALRLRTSLDSLSQGVAMFNADRQLTHWNECFQELLGLPKAMVRSGTPYVAFHEHMTHEHEGRKRGAHEQRAPEHGAYGQNTHGQVAGADFLETEDQVRHGSQRPNEPVVYERVRADGAQLELRRTAVPDGGFVLTVTDMTKRAQAEGVLREAQKMQAIGQLTGGIAHDFNNLLTVILGNLEIVRNKPNDLDKLKARMERAMWAAQRGATLTRQLLAFARKQPLTPAPIDLAAAMPDLVPLLRRTLGEHIEVRYVETAALWPAMADPAQLESAVLNLALNARDAMPGGGRLTIELANKVLDQDYARHNAEVDVGDYTMLAVSDTGHGMTPDVLDRVFEPFFTTKPDGQGTGLGLPMVFGFVKQSGGHVKIYSEPGEGTTVRLYLPRAVGGSAAAGQRSVAPMELPRGSATVLVVEDEPAVREIAVAMLGDLGYRVLEASDGEEGLRVFGAHASAIHLLLTDVVLPGKVRGRDLAERITEMRPEVKVVYMSGYTENSIVHNGRLDDGVQLISKPFQREQLARKVAESLADFAAAAPTAGEAKVVELKQRRAGE